MREIVDAKAYLEEDALLAILSLCHYKPTPEKVRTLAGKYSAGEGVEAYACRDGEQFVGLMVLAPLEDGAVEIRSIAVSETLQRGGVGRALVAHAGQRHPGRDLVAETDDDAVDFYRRCGFTATEIDRFPDVRRYRCVLPAEIKAEGSDR